MVIHTYNRYNNGSKDSTCQNASSNSRRFFNLSMILDRIFLLVRTYFDAGSNSRVTKKTPQRGSEPASPYILTNIDVGSNSRPNTCNFLLISINR